MKRLKVTGLLLFCLGFAIFNGAFFSASHRLTNDIIAEHIDDIDKATLFRNHSELINKPVASNFYFIDELDSGLQAANEDLIQIYSISDEEIDQLAEANTLTFDTASLSILDGQATGYYKQRTFKDYGSWLHQRTYSDKEAMKADITNVVTNIKEYQITQEKGFDEYEIDRLKYELTKASSIGPVSTYPIAFLVLTYLMCIVGALMYIMPRLRKELPGVKNNKIWFDPMKNVGWLGQLTGTYLIVFYIVLYFFPEYMTNWIIMVDPISQLIKGSDAGRFFLYGFIYTLCILVMGVRMIIKYRHSRYQIFRTISVMFFQTAFAFLIPEILLRLNKPYFDFKNIWPLDYDFFFGSELTNLINEGTLGIFMLGWGIALIIIAVPVFVYFFGKRWYCSWVCGCGGLAETLGDPYRQLSDKRLKAWKIERWMVHGVLVFAVVMTAGVLYTYWTGNSELLGISTYDVRSVYGAWIGAGFAGVVGTGFYPLMGNRVWCRFGCPLAAYLGIIQRFKSRFRITTNGGQCISCGNCSTYCEMGIDVRWYAQRGQNIVRASCVGCGVCSSVCPRGVLNLENLSESSRFKLPDIKPAPKV